MNKIKWITNDGDTLKLGFDTIGEAVTFIRGQSNNAEWRSQWDFRETERGTGVASTKACLVVHAPSEEADGSH